MMRYLLYLILYIMMQVIAYLITPILPSLAVFAEGWSDNHSIRRVEPRLPLWPSWFDTPDNSLYGDDNFMCQHNKGYWSQVIWLYRNSLYGFKWSVLAAPSPALLCLKGELAELDYHKRKFGSMWLHAGSYWQWKCVRPLGSKILILNFGWLLEDASQTKALFMFSPRLKG